MCEARGGVGRGGGGGGEWVNFSLIANDIYLNTSRTIENSIRIGHVDKTTYILRSIPVVSLPIFLSEWEDFSYVGNKIY